MNLSVDRMVVSDEYLRNELPGRSPNCEICGRFCYRALDRSLRPIWKCPNVFYDDYWGVWEHN